ncbi:MAG TPA: response regulator [Aliidongia sp.]|uniref:response regulator n=1 Tax=Aliidongia sp. TaxID=1914230 RepID=UPI002DDD5FE7|nr:response regulator [Aliidongia sp.]HEV2678658.1 response regulator [Aliidongia sp.]
MSIAPPDEPSPAQKPVQGQPCVLIVEDDAMVATYVADVLAEAGFEVAGVASTASEAFTLAEARPCILALVDIRLPGPKDGIEIAGELRRRYGIGAIFLSGTSDPEHLARAKRVSPYGFLQKPFLPSQMYKALDKALKQRQAERGDNLGSDPA